jgi:anion-transporting  ArsA/GET3 family ATPase
MTLNHKANEIESILERQLHFVCGKGGVGKTSIAFGLAQQFSDAGHRTLLCQMNAADSPASLFGTASIGPQIKEIRPHFWAVNIQPEAARREYALLILKFESVVRAVFDNRIAKIFFRFIPALSELNMLGKVWFHAEEPGDGHARRYDKIVIDCPATGHGMGLLRVAQVIHRITAGIGPMAEKTAQMQATLSDPSRTALHLVAMPEETPVNELLDLVQRNKDESQYPTGLCFLNHVVPTLVRDNISAETWGHLEPVFSSKNNGENLSIWELLLRRQSRERIQATQQDRIREEVPQFPLVTIPVIKGGGVDTGWADSFVAELSSALSKQQQRNGEQS